jgi:hypothetical protein
MFCRRRRRRRASAVAHLHVDTYGRSDGELAGVSNPARPAGRSWMRYHIVIIAIIKHFLLLTVAEPARARTHTRNDDALRSDPKEAYASMYVCVCVSQIKLSTC